jgi:hypothetical protein
MAAVLVSRARDTQLHVICTDKPGCTADCSCQLSSVVWGLSSVCSKVQPACQRYYAWQAALTPSTN